MTLWVAIGVLAVINFAIKAAGPALLGDRPLPPRVSLVVQSLAPALLAGLLIVALLGQGWREFDWRLLPGLTVIGAVVTGPESDRLHRLGCIGHDCDPRPGLTTASV